MSSRSTSIEPESTSAETTGTSDEQVATGSNDFVGWLILNYELVLQVSKQVRRIFL